MPVFYSPFPQNLQMSLAYVGGSVFTNNRTADSDLTKEQEDASGELTSMRRDRRADPTYDGKSSCRHREGIYSCLLPFSDQPAGFSPSPADAAVLQHVLFPLLVVLRHLHVGSEGNETSCLTFTSHFGAKSKMPCIKYHQLCCLIQNPIAHLKDVVGLCRHLVAVTRHRQQ